MTLVSQVLKRKGNDVWSVRPDDTVFEAVRMMAEKGVGALVVMEDDRLVGIISERDYARKIILEGKASRDTPVSEIMTRKVLCVSPDRTVDECLALMSDKRARHLPVVEDKHVIGVLSIGDMVKVKIDEQQLQIDQLKQYISG
ncbi:MAG: CBS domain-containing protein [Gammaproteobacteria bacterium]|nr:CBS domain-containing protein [Gammaproteobacteria bacterium]